MKTKEWKHEAIQNAKDTMFSAKFKKLYNPAKYFNTEDHEDRSRQEGREFNMEDHIGQNGEGQRDQQDMREGEGEREQMREGEGEREQMREGEGE